MKVVALKEAKAKLSGYCDEAQDERVLITRHGKPLVLILGIEGQDIEDVLTASNPDFWRLIEERRREPTISSAEMRERLRQCTVDTELTSCPAPEMRACHPENLTCTGAVRYSLGSCQSCVSDTECGPAPNSQNNGERNRCVPIKFVDMPRRRCA